MPVQNNTATPTTQLPPGLASRVELNSIGLMGSGEVTLRGGSWTVGLAARPGSGH